MNTTSMLLDIANLLTTSGALIFIIKVESRLTKLETHLFHLMREDQKYLQNNLTKV